MTRTRTRNTRSATRDTTKTAPIHPVPLVKLTKTPRRKRITRVDLRHQLPVRRRHFVGPLGPTEQAAVRAALAAAYTRLPITARTWNGSTAQLTDGTLLTHNPGPDRTFTAHIACRHGAIHGYPIHTHQDLREARALTHACERPHTPTNPDGDWDKAITYGPRPTETAPKPPVVHQLREGVKRARALHADTEPLTLTDIAAGLQARTAADTAKEHPQP